MLPLTPLMATPDSDSSHTYSSCMAAAIARHSSEAVLLLSEYANMQSE